MAKKFYADFIRFGFALEPRPRSTKTPAGTGVLPVGHFCANQMIRSKATLL
jgi:hypothetical protein